jgi:hypothetical protein
MAPSKMEVVRSFTQPQPQLYSSVDLSIKVVFRAINIDDYAQERWSEFINENETIHKWVRKIPPYVLFDERYGESSYYYCGKFRSSRELKLHFTSLGLECFSTIEQPEFVQQLLHGTDDPISVFRSLPMNAKRVVANYFVTTGILGAFMR